ncbi:MAG: beta-N-acetylhexosaminidase [Desulfatiglandaceae bacterium]
MTHSNLDLSELTHTIGRLFMAGMPGPTLDHNTKSLIRDQGLGGIILFSRNIEGPVQLAALCRDLQQAAIKAHGIPLFMAVDQEGGRVVRLREPFTQFPGNTAIGTAENPVEAAINFAEVTAQEMVLVGLNMDMAPVMDVRRGAPEKHLMDRTFSDDPQTVALLGRHVVNTLQKNHIMAVAKHFPGLGRTTMDPHHHLPTIDADEAEMERIHLPPFQAAIAAGVSSVMSSHALYPSIDPGTPATLSSRVINGILRQRLGFDGLVITDDLEMGAIREGWGVVKGAVSAFKAGCDILLICEDQPAVLQSMNALKAGILREEIPVQQLHTAITRINKTKGRFLKSAREISLHKVRDYFEHKSQAPGRQPFMNKILTD